jgi:hypothetical protein
MTLALSPFLPLKATKTLMIVPVLQDLVHMIEKVMRFTVRWNVFESTKTVKAYLAIFLELIRTVFTQQKLRIYLVMHLAAKEKKEGERARGERES